MSTAGNVTHALINDRALTFARQYKLQWEAAQQAYVLLYPEGMVRLTDSAGEILRRINGSATATDIVAQLESAYPDADLKQDVLDFLTHAYEKGWITHG